uniref:maestro heat-like repeat-containing protein family member 1 n=1 Tax=Panthera onca TaxID=9690 RepID=UPI0029555BE3|nr:maestro heat-like repeat-containing protein family member 1 [Panthera onca]
MCRQLPCYNGTPQEKNFLYKCVGTTLGAASSKEVVRKHLQELLETARHQEEAEREGLACCFGICAASHLDDVLAQLEDFMRSDVFRRSTGIFNIFKDRSENEVEKVKSTLILCYGHVAARAPRELVLAKVESDILRNIFQYFNTKVLGIKVETKVQCVGAKCELCLFSFPWAGLVVSFRGRSQGDAPWGSPVPVPRDSIGEHRAGRVPTHLGAASPLTATVGAQELVSRPGCWVVGGQKDGRRASERLAGRPQAGALLPDAHDAHLLPSLTNVFPLWDLWH